MLGKRKGGAPTIIGPGSSVEGTLRVSHGLHVEGTIEGDVHAEGEVSVGPDGAIRGTVTADGLAIAGTVEGTAKVRGRLHMLSSGRLRGDAFYQTLQVDAGGTVDGRTERIENLDELRARRTSGAPRPSAAEPSAAPSMPPAAGASGSPPPAPAKASSDGGAASPKASSDGAAASPKSSSDGGPASPAGGKEADREPTLPQIPTGTGKSRNGASVPPKAAGSAPLAKG